MMAANGPDKSGAAAFFDVDGTLVGATIVHYYVYFRRRRMTRVVGSLWYGAYLIKCGYYVVLDRFNRSTFNRVFYRDYAGLPADEIKAMARGCYDDVVQPRLFTDGAAILAAHCAAGCRPVLVTGSLDFIVAPLAVGLGVDDVIAPSLIESEGRFTGELDGPPIGEEQKALRIRQYAEKYAIDLDSSHAYGDSLADLPMLELVGSPHAVNPDRGLARIAESRGWPTHKWTATGRRFPSRRVVGAREAGTRENAGSNAET